MAHRIRQGSGGSLRIEKSVPFPSLISGFTKKHFNELSLTGICTCICRRCEIPSENHFVTHYFYSLDRVDTVCHLKRWDREAGG